MRIIKQSAFIGIWGYSLTIFILWALNWFNDIRFWLAVAVGLIVFFVSAVLSVLHGRRDHLDRFPPQDVRPHIPRFPDLPDIPTPRPPRPPPPREEEHRPFALLRVEELTLVIRGNNGGYTKGNRVLVYDSAIRPYAEITIKDDSVVGKVATFRFTIIGPRRRTRHDWQLDIESTLVSGTNKIWPETQEFPIGGHDRKLGEWRLILELVADGGHAIMLGSIIFAIRETEIRPIRVGADASVTRQERQELANDLGRQTVDDVLADW